MDRLRPLALFATLLLALAWGAHAHAACRTGWIINAGSLTRAEPALGGAMAARAFDNDCTFLTGKEATFARYAGWAALRTQTLTAAAQMDSCCGRQVRAVLYDPEDWPFTPQSEKADPARFACQLAAAAHARGLVVIATPATNLAKFAAAGEGGADRFDRFLRAGIAGAVARCVDVYEIQAQAIELDPARYARFVRALAGQARAANPRVRIFAGLSTNPNGRSVTPAQLDAAARAVEGVADGFWLNIPGGGAYCPRCGEPQPQVARELLARLAGGG